MSIEGIRNYIAASDSLSAGGQPTEDEMAHLAKACFDVVINLSPSDAECTQEVEAGEANRLELEYYTIPVSFQAPSKQDLQRFFDVLDAAQGKKIFVHCADNCKASCFVALYCQSRLNWSDEQAGEFIRKVWKPDDNWEKFIFRTRGKPRPVYADMQIKVVSRMRCGGKAVPPELLSLRG